MFEESYDRSLARYFEAQRTFKGGAVLYGREFDLALLSNLALVYVSHWPFG